MARILHTQALVIDSREHGEADLILTFLTPDRGKLSSIAKSAKKSKKRFVNKLEIFSFLEIQYRASQERSLTFLSEAQLHTPFLAIRKNPQLYTIASIIRELLLYGAREGAPDVTLFHLSLWALHRLTCNLEPATVLALFMIRFFDCMGYRPNLDQCCNCNAENVAAPGLAVDLQRGGILCATCARSMPRGPSLSPGSLKLLQSAQDIPLERLHRLKFSKIPLQESLDLLYSYCSQVLQRDITSWRMLRQFGILVPSRV